MAVGWDIGRHTFWSVTGKTGTGKPILPSEDDGTSTPVDGTNEVDFLPAKKLPSWKITPGKRITAKVFVPE